MANPMELYCRGGDWGFDVDSLIVLAYSKFAGSPVTIHKITNPWRSPIGVLPALKTMDEGIVSKTSNVIIHLKKLKYNADHNLSPKECADTLAFVCLLEEKLLPALIYSKWVDTENYVEVTRRWYGENILFPMNSFLANRMRNQQLEKLRLVRGDPTLESREQLGEQLEEELYRDALECMTFLSQLLGSHKFFFGDSPSSLDAYVYGHLRPLLKIRMPNGKLQQHLKSFDNLNQFCTNILDLYFPCTSKSPAQPDTSSYFGNDPFCTSKTPAQADTSSDFDNDPHKRRNQILSVLCGTTAMLVYIILTDWKLERPGKS